MSRLDRRAPLRRKPPASPHPFRKALANSSPAQEPHTPTQCRGQDLRCSASHLHLFAKLLRNDATHDGVKIFAGLLLNKSVSRFIPPQLETGGKRGDPDFAHGSVRGNHELGFLWFFEDDLELARFAFDVETMLVAKRQEPLLQALKRRICFPLKIFFFQHKRSLHEEILPGKRDLLSWGASFPRPSITERSSQDASRKNRAMPK